MQSVRAPKTFSGDAFAIDRLHISSVDDSGSRTPEYKLGRQYSPENLMKDNFKDELSFDAFTTVSPRSFKTDLRQSKTYRSGEL